MSKSTGSPISQLEVGQILRDGRPKSASPEQIDGFVNLYAATAMPNSKLIPFDAGINPLALVPQTEGSRRPAILISSSPHKSGSAVTPWQDVFEPDEGYVRYFGDAKTPGKRAQSAPGNELLLEQFEFHHGADSKDERGQAAPLIFFERQPHAGKAKGFPRFQGFGIITGARLVTQRRGEATGAFSNYEFEFAVLRMVDEGEVFNWQWINSRRNGTLSDAETLVHAPQAWKDWVADGSAGLPRLKRKVLKRDLTPTKEQLPTVGSKEGQTLKSIYEHYTVDSKKIYFESLAAAIAQQVIDPSGASYISHGVTRGSGDFGVDFIGQLDVGHGFSRAPLVVLGQAKCVTVGGQIDARDLARTVARLRRGWLGVFVTTGAVTPRAQQEVYEDRYPLLLITGMQVAKAVQTMLLASSHTSLTALLKHYDEQYELAPRVSDPEQLLT